VAVKEDLHLPLLPGEEKSLHCRIVLDETIRAPLAEGVKIGEAEIYLGNELLARAGLCSGHAVGKRGPLSYCRELIGYLLRGEVGD